MRAVFQRAVQFFSDRANESPRPNPADIFISYVPNSQQSQLNKLDDLLVNTFKFYRLGGFSEGQDLFAQWQAPGWGRKITLQVQKRPGEDALGTTIFGQDVRSSVPCYEFNRLWTVETTDLDGLIDYLEDSKSSVSFFEKREPIWHLLQSDMLGRRGIRTERCDNFPKVSAESPNPGSM